MPEGRMLKKCISDSKSLGELRNDSVRLLYTWLIPHLDVEGRYSADPDLIKGHIFPKITTMTPNKIAGLLKELAEEKLVIIYKTNGESYLQLKKFHDYQKLDRNKEAASKIPPPNRGSSGTTPDNSGITPEKSSTSKVKVKEREVKFKESISVIILYLNEKTNKNFSIKSQTNIDFINGRLNEGRTVDDFKHVIDVKVDQWKDDPKMSGFLRPSTLFRPTNFENYLNETLIIPAGKSTYTPSKEDEQRQVIIESYRKTLMTKYKPEIDKAKKAKDLDTLQGIEETIQAEVAQKSREI